MKQRIKMSFKKVVAIVLALALVSTGMYVGNSTVKAAEQNITITGVHQYSNIGAAPYNIWFNVEGTLPANGTTFTGLTIETTGNPNTSRDFLVDGGKLLVSLRGGYAPTTIQEGSTITIKAGTGTSSAGNIVITEDFVIEYNNGVWAEKIEEPEEPEATDITITGVNQYSNIGAAPYNIWFNVEGTLPANGTTFTGLTIETTGNPNTSRDFLVDGGKLLVSLKGGYAPTTIQEGSTITIKAGSGTSSAGNIVITEDFVIEYNNGVWAEKIEEPEEPEEPEATDITITGVKQHSNIGAAPYNIWFNVEGTLPANGTTFTGLTIETTGNPNTSRDFLVDGGKLLVSLRGGYAPTTIQEGSTITIKAGTGTSSAGNIVITEDFVIEYNNGVWAEKIEEPEEPEATDITITGVNQYSNIGAAPYNIWFNIEGTLPAEKTTFTGLTIETTGNPNTSRDFLVDGGKLLVSLKGGYAPTTIQEGSTITLKAGVGLSENGNIRISEDFTIIYIGGKWMATLKDSGVDADVNADESVDSRDLVRMLRFYKETGVAVNTERIDINCDGVSDEKDITSLKKVLLGMLYYNSSAELSSVPFGTPVFKNNVMEKVAYVCPDIKGLTDAEIDAEFQAYKATGMTLLCTELVAPLSSNSLTHAENDLLWKYLEGAQRNGLGVIVFSNYINYHLLKSDTDIDTTYENWKPIVKQYIDHLKQYPAFRGFMMADELPIMYVDNYSKVASFIRENYPDVILYSSQLPAEAYDASEDGPEKLTKDPTTNNTQELAFKDYVKNFGLPSGRFVYDTYTLDRADGRFHNMTDYKYFVLPIWFSNLKWVAEQRKSDNYAYTTGVTIQACRLDRGMGSDYEGYAPTQESDIGFQIYTAMAYGASEINFYTYEKHPIAQADSNGIKENSQVRSAVTAANQDADFMASAFMDFTWRDTLDVAENTTNSSTGNSRLASAQSEGARVFVGCMKNDDGFDGYMIANASEPRTSTIATVRLTFKEATKAIIYANGRKTTVELDGGVYTGEVGVGEGFFVIPVR